MKKQKLDLAQTLRDNKKFQRALTMAKTDAEREAIRGLVEGLVTNLTAALEPLIERATQDPDFVRQLDQALKEDQHVVTSKHVKSGLTE